MSEEKYKVSRLSLYLTLFTLIHPAQDSPLSQLQVTFAALQAGNQKVFNPTKLVESLQLRTSEQQDAQEYGSIYCLLKQVNAV
jgi:hypothetical protein